MSGIVSFGAFELDTIAHQLRRDGEAIRLPPKAVDALELMVSCSGQLVSRNQLVQSLWGDRIVNEQGLNQLIYLLRQALGRNADGQQWIETVPKRGYRFNGLIRSVQSTALARPATGTIEVAVLPLVNLPASDRHDLGLAFADSLITRLARESSLVLRPLAAVQRLDPAGQDFRQAIRALQVEQLIEGSIQCSAGKLLVNLRLWDRSSSTVNWADRFSASADQLFELEDRAADALIKQLLGTRQPVSPTPAMPRRCADPTARKHLLRSRLLWNQWNPGAWHQAIREAQLALEIDPKLAEAHYWWAVSLIALAITGQSPPAETFHRARSLINEAIRLDPELDIVWEGLGAIALFHDWDFAQARQWLEKAVETNPNAASARNLYALSLAASGNLTAALREAEAALAIDPLAGIVGTDLGYLHAFAGNHEKAVDCYRSVLDLYPLFSHARGYLSMSLSALGQGEAAAAEAMRAIVDAGRDPSVSHELALAWKAAGKLDQAETILKSMRTATQSDRLDPYFTLLVAAALGHLDEAIDWLRLAIVKRSRDLCYARVDPALHPIRSLPEFKTQLEKVLPDLECHKGLHRNE